MLAPTMHASRGRISHKAFQELRELEGLSWITALKSTQIRSLVEGETLQLGLFDERNLVAVLRSGYEDVSMKATAVAAGVSNMTLHQHDLFGAVISSTCDHNRGRASEARCLRRPRACCDLVQFSRAATPHMTTKPALPYGAPPGPVMNPSRAIFKMRNSSFKRPR